LPTLRQLGRVEILNAWGPQLLQREFAGVFARISAHFARARLTVSCSETGEPLELSVPLVSGQATDTWRAEVEFNPTPLMGFELTKRLLPYAGEVMAPKGANGLFQWKKSSARRDCQAND
jgi:hypothetical protein